MRILHTADWHLGRTLEGRSRLEEQAAFLDELSEIVTREQIDCLLIAGDVYDSVNPPAAAEQLFYETMDRLAEGGRPIIVIAGNHDNPDRLSAAAPLASRQDIHIVGLPVSDIHSLYIRRTGESAVLFALPYPSESRLRELLTEEVDESALRSAYSERISRIISRQRRHFSPRTVNLLMSHLYVMGGAESDSERPIQVGGAYTVDTSALYAEFMQYAALGHLHRAQTIPGEYPVRYSGSPLAYSFSEAGQAKSVTVIDVKPGVAAQTEELFLRSGRPLVKWKARGGIEQVYQWLNEKKDDAAWIDLEIHMTQAPTMEQIQTLRKWHGGLIHIRPVYPEAEMSDSPAIQPHLPADELFRRFYMRQTGGAEPDSETVRLFLELLLDSGEQDAGSAEGDQHETDSA